MNRHLHHFSWLGHSLRRLRKQLDGFTLVEMLVVITIIGLIMGLVGPRVLNYLSDSKLKAARIQIESFAHSRQRLISGDEYRASRSCVEPPVQALT